MLVTLMRPTVIPVIYISSRTNRIVTISHGLSSSFEEESGEVFTPGEIGGSLDVPSCYLHLVQHVADQRVHLGQMGGEEGMESGVFKFSTIM